MITFGRFDVKKYKNCYMVTDAKVAKLFNITGNKVYLLPRGEQAKTMHFAQDICNWLLNFGAEKSDLLVAIGGGSVGDVVGFAASIYKRGIKLLHVPTTLVAQIDSSIGGKTAVNFAGVKNAIGTFYMADTLIDVSLLKTLDSEQVKNGYGELLKYRMLDATINKVFLQGYLPRTIETCVAYKQETCKMDPFDQGTRKVLNFGHTIGHALELSRGLAHGEAVAQGLYYETLIAKKMRLCSGEYLAKWREIIEHYFPIKKITQQDLWLISQDKKNSNGQVCFVLPCENGFVLRYLSEQQVMDYLCNA